QEIYKREKDTLAQINHGKRLGFVEQIEEIAQEAGLVVPSDLKDDLMWKDYEKLKAFVKYLYSKQWDPAMLRNEIEGFRK
ncbi:MAG: hypothetical protein ACXVP2_11810, partial [Tumebacillaceae bacterium]